MSLEELTVEVDFQLSHALTYTHVCVRACTHTHTKVLEFSNELLTKSDLKANSSLM